MRIITVYSTERRATALIDMSYIRWFRMSEALAALGHEVDIATAEFKWRPRKPVVTMGPRLRRVPLSRVRWQDYDVVKTLFHRGYETLRQYGGHCHPFIVSKLGSVVDFEERDGIYFYGAQRAGMYAVQEEISRRSRYVTLLSEPAVDLWRRNFGTDAATLLVPGAAEREIPPSGPDPYPSDGRVRCIFAGNFYSHARQSQGAAHLTISAKLNELGRRLAARGARLYVVGPGDRRSLDPEHVTYCGVVAYAESWAYLLHADVGVLVSAGRFMHNNESTKIYYYLRAGLPMVGEAGFPNDRVVEESGLGFLVENANLEEMAGKVLEAAGRSWDRQRAIRYILDHHTWDQRAQVYAHLLRDP